METNYDKFSAAKVTPLSQPPFLDEIGATASTPIADSILENNNYSSTIFDEYIQKFVEQCQVPEKIRSNSSVSPVITTEQHISFWNHQKEKTQSSFSGLHFGFFKTTTKVQSLASILASLVNIPFCTGYSPDR